MLMEKELVQRAKEMNIFTDSEKKLADIVKLVGRKIEGKGWGLLNYGIYELDNFIFFWNPNMYVFGIRLDETESHPTELTDIDQFKVMLKDGYWNVNGMTDNEFEKISDLVKALLKIANARMKSM